MLLLVRDLSSAASYRFIAILHKKSTNKNTIRFTSDKYLHAASYTNSTMIKAGYTATPVAYGWAGAVLEKVTRAFGQEQ